MQRFLPRTLAIAVGLIGLSAMAHEGSSATGQRQDDASSVTTSTTKTAAPAVETAPLQWDGLDMKSIYRKQLEELMERVRRKLP